MIRHSGSFTWDPEKESANIRKHGVDFVTAAKAFLDVKRKIYTDEKHSAQEDRFFLCRKGGKWDTDGQVHLPRRSNKDNRRRLLAQRDAIL